MARGETAPPLPAQPPPDIGPAHCPRARIDCATAGSATNRESIVGGAVASRCTQAVRALPVKNAQSGNRRFRFQGEMEGRPAIDGGFGPDPATVPMHDPLD